MTDDDQLTAGEIRRAIKRLEDEDRALAARLVSLAAEMLPVKLWDSEHRALSDKLALHQKSVEADRVRTEEALKDLREELKDLREEQEQRSAVTWQKVLGLIVALATIAGVFVTLIGQTKGIK